MKPNRPKMPSSGSASILVSSPVLTFLTIMLSISSSPQTSSTTVSHRKAILGLAKAFSWMLLAARSSLRRWIMVTLRANLDRYMASSTAESPPPTTYTSKSSKKEASQVAQKEMPLPTNLPSFLQPMGLGKAPVARMTVLARYSPLLPTSFFTSPCSSTLLITSEQRSAPNFLACSVIRAIRLGPLSPSTIWPG